LPQVAWILEGQISVQTIEDVSELNLISLAEFNSTVTMYSSTEMVERYQVKFAIYI
jgi:hypothetical protein